MNFRPRPRDEIGLDLTSLIDVVFLLLLFFMLTTTFVETGRLKVDLPEAGEAAAEGRQEQRVIEIDAQGRYALDGEEVHIDQLAARLRPSAGGDGEGSVLVRADGRASHQDVVRALDAARAAGIRHVGIATVPPSP